MNTLLFRACQLFDNTVPWGPDPDDVNVTGTDADVWIVGGVFCAVMFFIMKVSGGISSKRMTEVGLPTYPGTPDAQGKTSGCLYIFIAVAVIVLLVLFADAG